MVFKPRFNRNVWIGLAAFSGLLGEEMLAQREISWTLWAGLVLLAISIWILLYRVPPPLIPESPTRRTAWPKEWAIIVGILLLGAFFRWYQLDRVPAGIFLDQGGWGWGAERILYNGWRPFYDRELRPFYETSGLGVWEMFSYYQLAAWFCLFAPSKMSLFSFSNFISLLGSILAYWVFRQWGTFRASWVALFFMVTMRWYLNFSRCAHPAYDVPFYLCGTLALWLYAHKTDHLWAWIGCALWLSAGFYAYPALLATPLLMVFWLLYEWKNRPSEHPKLARGYALGFCLTVLLSTPIWLGMLVHHSIGMREEQDWFFSNVHSGLGTAIARHMAAFLLMFDRSGDSWVIHNWPYYRTLDEITGFLFLLGLVYAFRKWNERPFFYCLSGIFVMSLPGLLTWADASSSHFTGLIPFLAYLAAFAFDHLWLSWDKTKNSYRNAAFLAATLLLIGTAWINFHDYFFLQQKDPAVCSAFYPDDTAVGERVNRGLEKEFFLSPKFFGNFDVEFLAYRKIPSFRKLDFWNLPEIDKAGGNDALFVLDEGKTGFLQLLQKTYPGGMVETYEYFKGWPLAYFYRVPAGSPRWTGPLGGIQGVYRLSGDWNGPPVLVRTDPFLNFTFRNDFGLADFKTLSVRWTGFLQAPQRGFYSFLALTTGQSAAWVDGKKVLEGNGNQEGVVLLTPGRHRILVDFQKLSGVDTAFNLLWKVPGSQNYRIVPFWQWGIPVKTAVQTAKP